MRLTLIKLKVTVEFSYAKLAVFCGKWGRGSMGRPANLGRMEGRTERIKCKMSPAGGGQAGRWKAVAERQMCSM